MDATDRVKASYAAVNASQSPLWVAQDRGFFAKYGIEADLVFISSGSLNVQALVGNTVQFAAGGPAALEARLRGPKLVTIANPLTVLASNLVSHPDIKSIADLKGKVGAVSRFASSSHQGLRYLFRKNGLSESDLKLLQLGGDSGRLTGLTTGKVQYTFLGAAASEQARKQGLTVLATAKQMAIPFPWTSVVVHETWLEANRDLAYRYVKAVTEAVSFMKRNRSESERIISKYMKLTDRESCFHRIQLQRGALSRSALPHARRRAPHSGKPGNGKSRPWPPRSQRVRRQLHRRSIETREIFGKRW